MPELPITWVVSVASLGVVGTLAYVAKRIVSFVDTATAKLVSHDDAIAQLQKEMGAAQQENKDQWSRINGVSENHGNRLTALEVRSTLERK